MINKKKLIDNIINIFIDKIWNDHKNCQEKTCFQYNMNLILGFWIFYIAIVFVGAPTVLLEAFGDPLQILHHLKVNFMVSWTYAQKISLGLFYSI